MGLQAWGGLPEWILSLSTTPASGLIISIISIICGFFFLSLKLTSSCSCLHRTFTSIWCRFDVQSNQIDHPIPILLQTVVVWFTLIITSIIAGTRPASITHWIWWGRPAVIFEIVQAASCEEKDRVHMEIIKVHTSFCSHLMLINFVFFFPLLEHHTCIQCLCILVYVATWRDEINHCVLKTWTSESAPTLQRVLKPYLWSKLLYRIKLYSNERPSWSELRPSNGGHSWRIEKHNLKH